MSRIKELRQRQAKAIADAQEVRKNAEANGRQILTEDEEQLAKRFLSDYDTLENQVKLEEQIEERQRAVAGKAAGETAPTPTEGAAPRNDLASPEYRAAYWNAMRWGANGVSTDEQGILSRGRCDISKEVRAMSGLNPTAGGFAIPPGTQQALEVALKQFGSVEQAGASVITTANGNDINWPTSNDTGNYGELIGENTAVGSQDPSLGNYTLKAYIFSSKKILVPFSLLEDGGFDLEGFVMRLCGERIGRIQNQKYTIGTGNAQPTGVVNAATLGKAGATGQATTIKNGDELIELIGALEPAYLSDPTCGFMFKNTSLTKILSLKDGQGNYLMTPGLVLGAPASIRGYRYTLNAEMATMAASAKSILFGAFSKYVIRRVGGGVTMLRLDQVNATSLQMTYLGFHRSDGFLLDAGTNPMVYWANSAS